MALANGTVTEVSLTSSNGSISVVGIPVTQSGTYDISLIPSGVSAGLYNIGSSSVDIDLFGRICSITPGVFNGVTSIGLFSQSLKVSSVPITTSGLLTVDLQIQNLIPGNMVGVSIANPNITLNQYGVVTSISPGSSAPGTVTSVGLFSPTNSLVVSSTPVQTSGVLNIDLPLLTPNLAGQQLVNPTIILDDYGRVISAVSSANNQVTNVSIASTPQVLSSSSSISNGLLNISLNSVPQLTADQAGFYPFAAVTTNIYGLITSIQSCSIKSNYLSIYSNSQISVSADLPVISGLPTTTIPLASLSVNQNGIVTGLSVATIQFNSNYGITSNYSSLNQNLSLNLPSYSNVLSGPITVPTINFNQFGIAVEAQNGQNYWNTAMPTDTITQYFSSIETTGQGLVVGGTISTMPPINNLTSNAGTIVITQNPTVNGNTSWNIDLAPSGLTPGTYYNLVFNKYGECINTANQAGNTFTIFAGLAFSDSVTGQIPINGLSPSLPNLSVNAGPSSGTYIVQDGYLQCTDPYEYGGGFYGVITFSSPQLSPGEVFAPGTYNGFVIDKYGRATNAFPVVELMGTNQGQGSYHISQPASEPYFQITFPIPLPDGFDSDTDCCIYLSQEPVSFSKAVSDFQCSPWYLSPTGQILYDMSGNSEWGDTTIYFYVTYQWYRNITAYNAKKAKKITTQKNKNAKKITTQKNKKAKK